MTFFNIIGSRLTDYQGVVLLLVTAGYIHLEDIWFTKIRYLLFNVLKRL